MWKTLPLGRVFPFHPDYPVKSKTGGLGGNVC
jgi:hypothetical protein